MMVLEAMNLSSMRRLVRSLHQCVFSRLEAPAIDYSIAPLYHIARFNSACTHAFETGSGNYQTNVEDCNDSHVMSLNDFHATSFNCAADKSYARSSILQESPTRHRTGQVKAARLLLVLCGLLTMLVYGVGHLNPLYPPDLSLKPRRFV